jgi:hypothetical protein
LVPQVRHVTPVPLPWFLLSHDMLESKATRVVTDIFFEILVLLLLRMIP